VALKGEVGSGVAECGKQCGGWFLWSLCVFGCISVVVEGACVVSGVAGSCGCIQLVQWAGQSVGCECLGGKGSVMTGWATIRGDMKTRRERVDEKGQKE
jgi:hypothetical protein